MPNSRKSHGDEEQAEGTRSAVDFYETEGYNKAVIGFGMPNTVSVRTELLEFQKAWRASTLDEDVPSRFCVKKLDALPGQYKLRQIYATGNYRVAILFPYGRTEAYVIPAWKKSKQNNRNQVNLAKSRARQFWDRQRTP